MLPYIIASFLFSILFFRGCLFWYSRWRLRKSIEIKAHEDIVAVCDLVPLHVIAKTTINSKLIAGQSFRGEGRFVITQERFILGSTVGRLMEISPQVHGFARALGPRCLLLQGLHPSQRGELRIEIVIEKEEEWAAKINRCVQERSQ